MEKNFYCVKLLFCVCAIATCLVVNNPALAATKTPDKTAVQKPAKAPAKAQSEDEKYAQVYEKCVKEAEANEAKYDQLFNGCMEKNGFPQEEFETGGQPIPSGDGQDN